jgi:hydroxymethylglutaryl-CoA lyase
VAVDRRHRRDGAHRKDGGDLTSHGTRRADEAPVALPLRYAAPRTHAWALRIASRESFALDALCPVPSLWRVCDGGHAMEILAGCYGAAGCNPLSGFRSCLAAHAEITEAHLSPGLLERRKRTMTAETVKIIECPRDAWQSLPKHIPPETKADYLRLLVEAGFTHIDAVSFVSPAAVPQMADAERVLDFLDPPAGVEVIGIVVNEKGAERAIETGAVRTLGFPYSVSSDFLKRNQRQSPEEALDELEKIGTLAYQAGLEVVAYVSMAFGNPYGEPWDDEETIAACDLLADSGLKQISLADTVGLATATEVGSLVRAVQSQLNGVEIGVHLHARPSEAGKKIAAAYEAGCRRFDTALGGLGGCQFAQDALVGNLATETALAELGRLGASLPPLRSIDELLTMSRAIGEKFGATTQ